MRMDADVKSAQHVAAVHQWLNGQADAAKEVTLEFLGATSTSLSLKAKGMLFQVLLPLDPYQSEGPSDEMFMVINEDGSAPDSLMMALHERLECVRLGPHSLGKVLDVFPKVLRTFSKKRTALQDELVDFTGQMGLLEGSGQANCKTSMEQGLLPEHCSKKLKCGNAKLLLAVSSPATASALASPTSEAPASVSTPATSVLLVEESVAATATATRAIVREFQIVQNEIVKAKAAFMISSSNNDQLVTKPFLSNISVEIPNESDVYLWHIKLGKDLFESCPKLYRDLQFLALQMNEPEAFVLLEATFSGEYPFTPPFVRVVRPRFIFHTGHVTKGGSLCMELLTESGWLPSYSFETVLVQIVYAFIEGKGRIDMRAHGREYSRKEAEQSFDEVVNIHGWTPKTMPLPR